MNFVYKYQEYILMKKQLVLTLTALTLSVFLTACSGGSGSTASFKSDASYDGGTYDAAGSTYEMAADDYDHAGPEEYAGEEMTRATGEGGETPEIDENADTESRPPEGIDREKIVYSGNMTIETLEYEDTVRKLYDLIEQKEGIIQSENSEEYSSSYGSDISQRSLDVTIRIPAKDFRSFISGANGIGKVRNMYTNADNITRTYYDVAARRSSLRTELDRLEELMTTADTTEDVIAIMDRMAYVQGDLDALEAQLRNMDTDVAYSTLTVTIREVIEYSATPESFGERVADAIKGSWLNFVRYTQNFIIFVIYLLPLLIVLAVIGICALAVILVVSKRIKKKNEAKWKEIKKPEEKSDLPN